MSITLTEMRNSVIDDNLNTNLEQFGFTKVDRAIRWAGNEFLRKTRCTRTSGTVTIADAATTVNVAATITDFLPGRRLEPPTLNTVNRRLTVVGYDTIRYWRKLTSATGTPEMIHFINGNTAEIFPTADAAYTMRLIYWQPLTSWTTGIATSDSVTLNIPDAYVDIVAIGAAAHLLQGQPGQQDWAAKMQEFRDGIASATAETTDSGVWQMHAIDGYDNSYARSDYIP